MIIYKDVHSLKKIILEENKGKSVIYRWVNKETGKSYVGSAVDLSKRFRIYYSLLSIEKFLNKSKSYILSALLKDGYSKFTLEILEYCDPKDLLKREQYYIDLLDPEYNIIKIAGSRFGSIHTKETRAKMSSAQKGLKAGELNPMFGKIGELNPMYGKPRPVSAGKFSQKIVVLDLKENTRTEYPSISTAAIALNIRQYSISNSIRNNQTKPFKDKYKFYLNKNFYYYTYEP